MKNINRLKQLIVIFLKKKISLSLSRKEREQQFFSGDLQGLVLIEFEFENKEDFLNFSMPDFVQLMLRKKNVLLVAYFAMSIDSLKEDLDKFGYKIIG